MSDEEYQQYTVFLKPEQWAALEEAAKRMGIGSRQPLVRWAVDAFLVSRSQTYHIIKNIEPDPEQVTV